MCNKNLIGVLKKNYGTKLELIRIFYNELSTEDWLLNKKFQISRLTTMRLRMYCRLKIILISNESHSDGSGTRKPEAFLLTRPERNLPTRTRKIVNPTGKPEELYFFKNKSKTVHILCIFFCFFLEITIFSDEKSENLWWKWHF